MKKVLFIYTDWNSSEARKKINGYGGVSYYRVIQPALALKALGFDVEVVGKDLTKYGETPQEIWPTVFSEFDAVVVKAMDNPQAAAPLFYFAQQYGVPVIIDLDDNYFAVKEDSPAWNQYHPGSQKRAIFAATLSLADALFVSTAPLETAYTRYMKEVYGQEMPIFVLPNANNLADWPPHRRREDKKKVTIGYAGSITHNSDLMLVLPVIVGMMDKNPNLYFEILGAMYKKDLEKMLEGTPKGIAQRIKTKNGTHSWRGYPALLVEQDWDIGICPLVDDEFTRGKSHIKWMEYTMAGIPVVASPTYPYSEPILGVPVIEDGRTGFFASSPAEWEMVLSRLIADGALRREIAEAARTAIAENWQYSQKAFLWADALNDVICNFQTRRTKMASSKTAKTTAD